MAEPTSPVRPTSPGLLGWSGRLQVEIEGLSGGAQIVFSERDGALTIETVYVPPPARSTGVGTALMDRVLALADAAGLPCRLTARPIGHHGPEATAGLVRFYRRFGFEVVNPGETVPRMVRPPAAARGPG